MSTFDTGTFDSGTFDEPVDPTPQLQNVKPTDGGSYAERLYAMLEPMQYGDPHNGWALYYFLSAIGQMFEEIEDYARDITIDGKPVPGWSVLLDLDRTPSKALGWLAQFVGVSLQPGLSDDLQRERIRETDGWKRGSVQAMIGAARQYLSGRRTVLFRERYTSPYHLVVITRWAETPDPGQVLGALMSQKPAGITLDYHTINGRDYQEVKDNNANYQAAKTAYATYEVMRGSDITAGPPSLPLVPQESLTPAETLPPGG